MKKQDAIAQPVAAASAAVDEPLLTVEEIAAYLRVPATSIYQLTRARQRKPMPAVRVGMRLLRFRKSEVSAWLDSLRRDAAA